jgi:hypothetical protein
MGRDPSLGTNFFFYYHYGAFGFPLPHICDMKNVSGSLHTAILEFGSAGT